MTSHHYHNMSKDHEEYLDEDSETTNSKSLQDQNELDSFDTNFTLPFSGGGQVKQMETLVRSTMKSVMESVGDTIPLVSTTTTQLNTQLGKNVTTSFLELFVTDDSSTTVISAEHLPSHTVPALQRLVYSIIIPLMLLFCILSSLVNLIIVLSVRWCRKPMSPTLYFSISLALADAFASIVLGIGLVVNSLLPTVFSITFQNYCFPLAVEAFRLGGVLVTVTHLLALAINHWMGIVRPLHYESTMTRGTALKIIILSWFCPISLLLVYFSKSTGEGFRSEKCQDQQFLYEITFRRIFASLFFAPLIAMIFIYIHIFIIVRNHLHYRLKYQSCQQLRRNVKAVVTTVLILGTYIVGWMPAILWYITVCDDCIVAIDQVPRQMVFPVSVAINTLVILKAFVDPIIYAARMSDIQVALKKMRYDFVLWIFGGCVSPPRTMDQNTVVLGSVRFTKSFRLSSRGSSSRSNV